MDSTTREQAIRILVTDSNSRVRDLLRRELEKEGYIVSTVSNGKIALDLMATPGYADLVILDPTLFCPYGRKMIQDIASRSANIPVIIHSFEDQRQEISCLHSACFVDKGTHSIKHLVDAIRTCVARKPC